QRNLFSLLLTVQSAVPKDCLSRLLQASRQDPSPDLWVQRLRDLLQMGLQEKSLAPILLSDACQQRLKGLCQKVTAPHCSKPSLEKKLSWYVKQADPSSVMARGIPGPVSHIRKKKKLAEEPLDPAEERSRKRSRLEVELDTELSGPHAVLPTVGTASAGNEIMMEVSGNEDGCSPSKNVYQSSPKKDTVERRDANQSTQQDNKADHSDGTAPPELQILNECTPSQLDHLCSLLQLSECQENELLQFCSWLVALTPDLGYSNAAVLAGKLFLPRVLLLTEPASWSLTTALMMFCSKYSRPVCCTLIFSIVQAPEKCELIKFCLFISFFFVLLCSHIVEVPWSENLLTVVHSLLGRQVELSTELFNMLVLNLCQKAQEFATSMHFAKLVLTLLTKYQSNVSNYSRCFEVERKMAA
uniref:FA complementation group E n=1 Tax=Varanus komodoensis TaxID=61221 RepID=A0A8D2KZI0_VARKO